MATQHFSVVKIVGPTAALVIHRFRFWSGPHPISGMTLTDHEIRRAVDGPSGT